MTLKYELRRLVAAQYANGEVWRNNFGKNEETQPKRKHHPLVDVIGGGNKVQAVKNTIASGNLLGFTVFVVQ